MGHGHNQNVTKKSIQLDFAENHEISTVHYA